MGANEIANRVEASAWIAAAGDFEGEGFADVKASDFFFRSISGFVEAIEVLNLEPGDSWDDVNDLIFVLTLDREYSRRDTTFLLQPIESFRADVDNPASIAPLSYEGIVRVLPVSEAGYQAVISGGAPSIPADLDPYVRVICFANLSDFQLSGAGLEFGIQVLRMPDNESQNTTVTFKSP